MLAECYADKCFAEELANRLRGLRIEHTYLYGREKILRKLSGKLLVVFDPDIEESLIYRVDGRIRQREREIKSSRACSILQPIFSSDLVRGVIKRVAKRLREMLGGGLRTPKHVQSTQSRPKEGRPLPRLASLIRFWVPLDEHCS